MKAERQESGESAARTEAPSLRVLPANIDEALKLRDCARMLMDYPNRKSFELGYWMDRWLDRYMVPLDNGHDGLSANAPTLGRFSDDDFERRCE